MKRTRRDFLRKGMISVAGASILPNFCKSEKKDNTALDKDFKIIHRTLGKTGLKVPVVSMGIDDNVDLVPRAVELGLTHFQTSSYYRYGKNESEIGRILESKPRDKFVLATGFSLSNYTDERTLKIKDTFNIDLIKRSVENSLRQLRTEYIDIYYLFEFYHRDGLKHQPLLETMKGYKEDGKIRFIGASTHHNEPAVIRAVADSGIFDVVETEYNFRKNNDAEIEKAVNYAENKGIGKVVMKTKEGV